MCACITRSIHLHEHIIVSTPKCKSKSKVILYYCHVFNKLCKQSVSPPFKKSQDFGQGFQMLACKHVYSKYTKTFGQNCVHLGPGHLSLNSRGFRSMAQQGIFIENQDFLEYTWVVHIGRFSSFVFIAHFPCFFVGTSSWGNCKYQLLKKYSPFAFASWLKLHVHFDGWVREKSSSFFSLDRQMD